MTVANEWQEAIHTLYNHAHNADGSERAEHCCGCWVIKYNDAGLYAECNECGERRSIDPRFPAPPFAERT